jgi:hypothetical protein
VLVIVLILGVLGLFIVPQFGHARSHERTTLLHESIRTLRGSILVYASRSGTYGDPVYPTILELRTERLVFADPVPVNPFNGRSTIQLVTPLQATKRETHLPTEFGWNYMAEISPINRAVFYANSDDPTTDMSADGEPIRANMH